METDRHPTEMTCPGRRKFLKAAGITGMGLATLGSFGCSSGTPKPEAGALPEAENPSQYRKPEQLAVASLPKGAADEEIVGAVRSVAEAATDFSWLSRGDTVFIKPVANSPNMYPATTAPQAVFGVTKLLLEKGAGKVIVGDKPGVLSVFHEKDDLDGSSREVLTTVGLHQAALDAGAEVHYFDEAGYDAYSGFHTVNPGHWKGELILPNILNQADHIVLLPRVSRHTLAGTTLGLKAAVGWLRDDSRLEFHRDADSFYDKIAEINDATVLRSKLRLALSVATQVLSTYGPDKGYVTEPDPGLVFASESLIAHDMAALGWLLWNREFETPPGEISFFSDPYTGIPSSLNRGFVGYMWGLKQWWNYKHYDAPEITSVWNEPVILRGAQLFGGMPVLEIEDVNGKLPEKVKTYIESKC